VKILAINSAEYVCLQSVEMSTCAHGEMNVKVFLRAGILGFANICTSNCTDGYCVLLDTCKIAAIPNVEN
jgi:hypothetical protein